MIILNSKIRYIFLLVVIMGFLGADENCIKGDGKLVSFEKSNFSIKNFIADGAFDIYIFTSKTYRLKIVAESNILKTVKKEIKADSLRLFFKESVCPRKDVKVELYVPRLELIKILGNIKLDFNLNGASLDIVTQGLTKVKGRGKLKKVNIHSEGSSELDLLSLDTQTTTVKSDGMFELETLTRKSLVLDSDGMVDISLKGNATIDKKNSQGMISIDRI